MQKISPFLWFDANAEEAVNFYVSVFEDAKITATTYYQEGSPGPVGQAMTVAFELFGQEFAALNGGPVFSFNPAISFVVKCRSQEEVDRYWTALSDGGKEDQCGWLRDKYGVSWQIVPTVLLDMLQDPDPQKSRRVMEAMLQMVKIDVATLRRAYENG